MTKISTFLYFSAIASILVLTGCDNNSDRTLDPPQPVFPQDGESLALSTWLDSTEIEFGWNASYEATGYALHVFSSVDSTLSPVQVEKIRHFSGVDSGLITRVMNFGYNDGGRQFTWEVKAIRRERISDTSFRFVEIESDYSEPRTFWLTRTVSGN